MELHQIRYFLVLAETLNFTRAAKLCRISQPALTRAIARLEHDLGGLLVYRERNNTRLTELGRLVEPHLAMVMERVKETRLEASSFTTLDRADLAIGVMCTIGLSHFADLLGRFRIDHPGISLTLREAAPDLICEQLLAGEISIALMARDRDFPVPLVASLLYRERFVVACSTTHRFASREQVNLADMDGESYLTRTNCESRDILGEACDDHGAKLIRSYRSEREDWVLTMVAAGLGVCFLPEFSACFPGIVARPLGSPLVTRDVCLITVAGRRQSPPANAFIRAVQKHGWPAFPAPADTPELSNLYPRLRST